MNHVRRCPRREELRQHDEDAESDDGRDDDHEQAHDAALHILDDLRPHLAVAADTESRNADCHDR